MKKLLYIIIAFAYVSLFAGTAYSVNRKLQDDRLPAGMNPASDSVIDEELSPISPEAQPDRAMRPAPHIGGQSTSMGNVRTPDVRLPGSFQGIRENAITGAQWLTPVLRDLRRGEKRVRIMQIGDSHIRGNILPRTLGKQLEDAFGSDALEGIDASVAPEIDGGIYFDYHGINGARTTRFCEEDMLDRITRFNPDLLIVSFGTNEAHGNFSSDTHQQTLDQLIGAVRSRCPHTTFLLTTPPGSYISVSTGGYRDRRGRWHGRSSFGPNSRNGTVAEAIADYGAKKHVAVWNLWEIAGGAAHACNNWSRSGMMQGDHIHYLGPGYELQGRLLAQAIIKAYNNTRY